MFMRFLPLAVAVLLMFAITSCNEETAENNEPDEDLTAEVDKEALAIKDADGSEKDVINESDAATDGNDSDIITDTTTDSDIDNTSDSASDNSSDSDVLCNTSDLKCEGTEIWWCTDKNAWQKSKDCKDESKICVQNGTNALCKKDAGDSDQINDSGTADADASDTGGSTGDIDTVDDSADAVPDEDTVCVPNCSGKACGDNGCGGSCGSCPIKTGSCLSGTAIEFFAEASCSAAGQCNYSAISRNCPIACGDGSYNSYGSDPTCYGSNPIGTLDGANEIGTNGWGCDADTPNKIDIHLYIDSVPGDVSPIVRVTKAQNSSEDAVNVQCGGSTGYRFTYVWTTADITQLGSGMHTVRAYGINNDKSGSNPEFSASPKTFTLP